MKDFVNQTNFFFFLYFIQLNSTYVMYIFGIERVSKFSSERITYIFLIIIFNLLLFFFLKKTRE